MGQTTEEGITDILDMYFTTPGDFTVRLCSDTSVAKDAVYADLTEVTGSGYAGVPLTTITTSTYSTDDTQAVGNDVDFNATGTWIVANKWFVTRETGVSGEADVLVCWNTLTGGATTLENGESITVSPILIGVG